MFRYIVEVEGMQCGMCEAHVNDTVRREFPVRKVTSSRKKRQTVILSDLPLDEQALADAIRATGYQVGGITREPYEKKGLLAGK